MADPKAVANFLCFRAPKLWPQPNGARLRCYDVLWWWIKGGFQNKLFDPKNSSKIETRNSVAIVVTCWMLLPAPIIPIDCNTMTSSPKKPKCWNTLVISSISVVDWTNSKNPLPADLLKYFALCSLEPHQVQGLETCGFGSSEQSEAKGGCQGS